jgi:uncharacterized protein YyaL (SSP411 family)
MDNATPSGASLAAELLARAGHVFDEGRYRDAASRIVSYEVEALERYGPAFGRMLSVLDRTLAEPVEVAIVSRPDEGGKAALIAEASLPFFRNATLVGRLEGETVTGVPLLEGRGLVEGRSTAYVCRRFTCRLPVTEAAALGTELDTLRGA